MPPLSIWNSSGWNNNVSRISAQWGFLRIFGIRALASKGRRNGRSPALTTKIHFLNRPSSRALQALWIRNRSREEDGKVEIALTLFMFAPVRQGREEGLLGASWYPH